MWLEQSIEFRIENCWANKRYCLVHASIYFSLMNFILDKQDIFLSDRLCTIWMQGGKKNAIFIDQLLIFNVFGNGSSMLASEFSSIYRLVSCLRDEKAHLKVASSSYFNTHSFLRWRLIYIYIYIYIVICTVIIEYILHTLCFCMFVSYVTSCCHFGRLLNP